MDFSDARTLKRFPLLDAARGLACIGVVAMHCRLEGLIPWFWGAMDFFFVMSGFLITRSLISNCNKGRGTPAFLLYRALRLLPAYLTIMLGYAVIASVIPARNPADVLPYVFLYQHTDLMFSGKEIFPRILEMAPYWSLVLEEHFYVVWGLIFCGFAYRKINITPVSIGLTVILLLLALLLRKNGMHPWVLPGRYDGFLVGSMMGVIVFMPSKVHISEKWSAWMFRAAWLVVAAALVRLIVRGVLSYRDYHLYLTGAWLDIACYTVVSVVIVLGLVKMDIRRIYYGKLQDWLAFIGLISYEIYLLHVLVVTLLVHYFNFNFRFGSVVLFLTTMVVASAVAHLMHKTLTAPALKQRERIHAFFTGLIPGKADTKSPPFARIPQDGPGTDDPTR